MRSQQRLYIREGQDQTDTLEKITLQGSMWNRGVTVEARRPDKVPAVIQVSGDGGLGWWGQWSWGKVDEEEQNLHNERGCLNECGHDWH